MPGHVTDHAGRRASLMSYYPDLTGNQDETGDPMPVCAKCGARYDEKFDGCPLCANAANQARPSGVTLGVPADLRSIFGIGGALLMLVGTFLPALRLSAIIINADYSLLGGGPFMDQMNASKDSPMAGFTILGLALAVLAVATAALIVLRIWQGLWVTGGLALAATGFGFFSVTSKIAAAVRNAGANGSAVSSVIQPGWGWAVMFVGAALVFGAALLSHRSVR
jgi:hypothetical protein